MTGPPAAGDGAPSSAPAPADQLDSLFAFYDDETSVAVALVEQARSSGPPDRISHQASPRALSDTQRPQLIGGHYVAESACVYRDPQVLFTLLHPALMARLAPSLRAELLETVGGTLRTASNAAAARAAGLPRWILGFLEYLAQAGDAARPLATQLAGLLRALWAHEASPGDVVDAIRLAVGGALPRPSVDSGTAVAEPWLPTLVLETLRSSLESEAAAAVVGPRPHFALRGPRAGIALDPIASFPATAYTLVLWFRPESVPTTAGSSSALYCLQSLAPGADAPHPAAPGLSCALEPGGLVLRALGSPPDIARVPIDWGGGPGLPSPPFQHAWHCLVVTHAKRTLLGAKAEVTLDGRPLFSGMLRFPKLASVGGTLGAAGPAGGVFQGQLGGFSLLSTAATAAEASAVMTAASAPVASPSSASVMAHTRAAGGLWGGGGATVTLAGQGGGLPPRLLFGAGRGDAACKLILSIDPRHTDPPGGGGVVYTPCLPMMAPTAGGGAAWAGGERAVGRLMPGTVATHPISLSECFVALGGGGALLPLLLQPSHFSRPAAPAVPSDPTATLPWLSESEIAALPHGAAAANGSALGPMATAAAAELIPALLSGPWPHHTRLVGGWGVTPTLGGLLARLPPQHLTPRLATAVAAAAASLPGSDDDDVAEMLLTPAMWLRAADPTTRAVHLAALRVPSSRAGRRLPLRCLLPHLSSYFPGHRGAALGAVIASLAEDPGEAGPSLLRFLRDGNDASAAACVALLDDVLAPRGDESSRGDEPSRLGPLAPGAAAVSYASLLRPGRHPSVRAATFRLLPSLWAAAAGATAAENWAGPPLSGGIGAGVILATRLTAAGADAGDDWTAAVTAVVGRGPLGATAAAALPPILTAMAAAPWADAAAALSPLIRQLSITGAVIMPTLRAGCLPPLLNLAAMADAASASGNVDSTHAARAAALAAAELLLPQASPAATAEALVTAAAAAIAESVETTPAARRRCLSALVARALVRGMSQPGPSPTAAAADLLPLCIFAAGCLRGDDAHSVGDGNAPDDRGGCAVATAIAAGGFEPLEAATAAAAAGGDGDASSPVGASLVGPLGAAWPAAAAALRPPTPTPPPPKLSTLLPAWLPDDAAWSCLGGGSGCLLHGGKPWPPVGGGAGLLRGSPARHHCRLCGGVFCAPCTKGRSVLPVETESVAAARPQRLCAGCLADAGAFADVAAVSGGEGAPGGGPDRPPFFSPGWEAERSALSTLPAAEYVGWALAAVGAAAADTVGHGGQDGAGDALAGVCLSVGRGFAAAGFFDLEPVPPQSAPLQGQPPSSAQQTMGQAVALSPRHAMLRWWLSKLVAALTAPDGALSALTPRCRRPVMTLAAAVARAADPALAAVTASLGGGSPECDDLTPWSPWITGPGLVAAEMTLAAAWAMHALVESAKKRRASAEARDSVTRGRATTAAALAREEAAAAVGVAALGGPLAVDDDAWGQGAGQGLESMALGDSTVGAALRRLESLVSPLPESLWPLTPHTPTVASVQDAAPVAGAGFWALDDVADAAGLRRRLTLDLHGTSRLSNALRTGHGGGGSPGGESRSGESKDGHDVANTTGQHSHVRIRPTASTGDGPAGGVGEDDDGDDDDDGGDVSAVPGLETPASPAPSPPPQQQLPGTPSFKERDPLPGAASGHESVNGGRPAPKTAILESLGLAAAMFESVTGRVERAALGAIEAVRALSVGGEWAGGGVATTRQTVRRPMLDIPAELVRPMRVLRGRLALTASHLVFRCEPPGPGPSPNSNSNAAGAVLAGSDALREAALAAPRRLPLDSITSLYVRRHLLRRAALEVHTADGRAHFVHLLDGDRPPVEGTPLAGAVGGGGKTAATVVDALYAAILGLKPKRLCGPSGRRPPLVPLPPARLLRRWGATERWCARQMSTFDYLMALNEAAGRTSCSLTQWPVFPWVLADYTSESLDVTDPRVYRDLSRPIGALEPGRLAAALERYAGFDDPDIPKFHWGSHYSSLGTVLFYLLRLEPFTGHALAMQGGRFDHADRLFHSVAEAWSHVLTSASDVKELTPEWFCLPDFLRNASRLPLGTRQDGTRVHDVLLPPWAHGSPEEFVRLHRCALESETVSASLHLWIDLIFGHKQRGPAAVAAANVFYYLTYEGAVDLGSIDDPLERRAAESQIANFGQTPSQLFARPHPPRCPPPPPVAHPGWAASGLPPLAAPCPPLGALVAAPPQIVTARASYGTGLESRVRPPPGVTISAILADRSWEAIHLLTSDGVVASRRWVHGGVAGAATTGGGLGVGSDASDGCPLPPGFALEDRRRAGGGGVCDGLLSPVTGPTFGAAGGTPPAARATLVPRSAGAGALLIGGAWDGSVLVVSPSESAAGAPAGIAVLQSLVFHARVVTCVATSADVGIDGLGLAVTGSVDGTLSLWRCTSLAVGSASDPPIDSRTGPLAVLVGHPCAVSAADVSAWHGLVLSLSAPPMSDSGNVSVTAAGAGTGPPRVLLHSTDATGRLIRCLAWPSGEGGYGRGGAVVALGADGSVVAAWGNRCVSWGLNGTITASIDLGLESGPSNHGLGLQALAFAPSPSHGDGAAKRPWCQVVLCGGPGGITVRAAGSLRPLLSLAMPAGAGGFTAAAWVSGGRAVLAATADGRAHAYVIMGGE